MMYDFAFVMDQQVGLKTQALNVARVVAEDGEIAPRFVPVRYEADAGPLSRLPILPGGVRGTLKGVREIRDGLDGARPDAALWATWAAKSVPDLVAAAPSFLVMDMTPSQMEEMGALYGYGKGRARFLGGLKRRATDRVYRDSVRLFPWSAWAADSLVRDFGVPAEKVTVVSPGVDTDRYRPDPAERDGGDPAGRHGGGDGVVRVLFVGGDFHRKGGDLLLRWARERRGDLPVEVHLVTRDEVPGASDLPHVVVHRNVGNNSDALVRLYRRCDVFALPTRADCYSLVAMEAAACGLPAVISSLGGIPDIVAEGETGHLVGPEEYDVFAARLDSLVADGAKRAAMGAAARRRAVERFDCRANVGTVLAHMKEAAR
jgi:glycosyltransferase involved in cell wall biosynthesis